MDEPEDTRSPRSVYSVGEDADVRFSLANERTALAWVRTGLALIAGGVALTTVASFAGLPSLLDIVAAVVCLFGGFLAVSALVSWRRTERALRERKPLPPPVALPWLVGGVVLMAIVLGAFAIGQLVSRL